MEILNILLEKNYKKIHSIILAIFIAIVFGIILFFMIPNTVLKIISIICIFGILTYYIVITVLYNKLPKNKNGEAVLVRIIAKNEEEFEDIKFKFGNEFEKYINNNQCGINIIYIPYQLIDNNKSNEKEKVAKLLKKTNCVFLTTLRIRSEKIYNSSKYITEFNLGILHPAYEERVENMFQHEMNSLGKPIRRLEYTNQEKMHVLEFSAQMISCVCRYLIARAYYLGMNFERAQEIGEQLFYELTKCFDSDYDKIKKCVNVLCYDVHITKAILEYYKPIPNIEFIDKEVEVANKYVNGTYIYYEIKSVCSFLKDRDIKKTKDYLGNCKRINKNGPWKYSVAFISAYTNESEGRVLSKYKQAFKVPYPHIDLIEFIEKVLSEEPEKNMLRYALLLLYLKIENINVAKEMLNEYLEYKGTKALDNDLIRQLKRIYTKDILNEVLRNNND